MLLLTSCWTSTHGYIIWGSGLEAEASLALSSILRPDQKSLRLAEKKFQHTVEDKRTKAPPPYWHMLDRGLRVKYEFASI